MSTLPYTYGYEGISGSYIPWPKGESCVTTGCVTVGSMQSLSGFGTLVVTNDPHAPRQIFMSWTSAEDARLQQMATYLATTPEQLQHDAVWFLAFLENLSGSTAPTPATLPPAGTATTRITNGGASEVAVLDAVKAKYVVDDADAHRVGVYLLSFLLGLAGH